MLPNPAKTIALKAPRLMSLAAALVLSACASSDLPKDVACAAMAVGPDFGENVLPAISERAAQYTETVAVNGMADAFTKRQSQRGARVDVMLLSSGGQWGAFSAGFLNGWSKDYDKTLRDLYYGVAETDILRRRNALELLRAPSIWDPKPLERTVRKHLTRDLIAQIAKDAETRSLLVGAVNLQSGFFEAFDLTSMAASGAPQTAKCLSEGLLASAAIPIAFPPRRIGSALYADGAARQGLFLRSLARTDLRPTVYILVNNAVSFPTESPDFALTSLAGRAQSIVTDELMRSSAIEAVRFAKSQGWTVRGMVAPDIWPGEDCRLKDGSQMAFCPSFTRQLYDTGYAMAVDGKIRWLGADALIAQMRRQNEAQRALVN